MMGKFKSITIENIEEEHICCALSSGKNKIGVESKKEWMSKRLDEGLKFIKLDVRGKVFVEYMPSEVSWKPLEANGYNVIHCLWVSGKFKGKGYASQLIEMCKKDSEGKKGVVAITSKNSFMTEKGIYLRHGFQVIDQIKDYELLVYQFPNKKNVDSNYPRFTEVAKTGLVNHEKDLLICYTHQCPFVVEYSLEMKHAAEEIGLSVEMKKLTSPEEVRKYSSPFGTFSVYLHKSLLTHIIMAKKPFTNKLQKALKI